MPMMKIFAMSRKAVHAVSTAPLMVRYHAPTWMMVFYTSQLKSVPEMMRNNLLISMMVPARRVVIARTPQVKGLDMNRRMSSHAAVRGVLEAYGTAVFAAFAP